MTTTTPQLTAAGQPLDDPGAFLTSTQLRKIVSELADRYLERDSVVKALVSCMLAGEHSLVLGPPGTAKSELARDLTSRVQGARLWEILLSKYSDPKKMFGPIDVAQLMKGRYEQVWDGRATTCHIAFIDEIFKCGPAALNELLAFLNERLYHPEAGGSPISCPLVSAITASNELPESDESAAIYDRLLVRLEVGYLADPGNFVRLMRSATAPAAPPKPPTTVQLDDLQAAVRVHVPQIAVPDPIVDALCNLRATLRHAGRIVSDRRWKKAVRLLQAAAFLDGRNEVTPNDLALLVHVLWDSPADRPKVEREVMQLVNPDAREALDLLDGIEQLNAKLDEMAGKSKEELAQWGITEARGKLGRAGKKLMELREQSQKAGRSTTTLDEVISRYTDVRTRVMVEALDLPPTVDPFMANSGI